MTVRELLLQPSRYLGRRITVEGSAHVGTFADQRKHVWISDSISDGTEPLDPRKGILVKFPGIVERFLPSRSGPIFPMSGFECEATLVHSEQQPWSYALVELTTARYFQRVGDAWCPMNTGLIPDKTQLIEIIGARGYSDEEKADYVLKLMRRLTDAESDFE
jgi:hypothetical protein